MPPPRVEEPEQAYKRLVGNVDVGIVAFQLVLLEHATVEIRDAPVHILELVAVPGRVQPAVEQLRKETTVECLEEAVLAAFLLHPFQFLLQVVKIAVKEAFLLDEVTEHKAVEHDGRVPLLVTVLGCRNLVVDTRDKFRESVMFLAESRIKVLGDFLRVHGKRSLYALFHVHDGGLFFYVK